MTTLIPQPSGWESELQAQPATRRILLVEDDPDQRMLIRLFLVQAHYSVTDASSAEQAMALLESEADGYDLLLTDWNLPGIMGDVLITCARTADSSLPTILMSTSDKVRSVARVCGADASLSKFRLDQLVGLVNSLLAPGYCSVASG